MKETSQSRYDSWKFMFEKGDPKEMGRKRRRVTSPKGVPEGRLEISNMQGKELSFENIPDKILIREKWRIFLNQGGEGGGGGGGGRGGGGGGAKGGKGEGGRDGEERENGEAEPRQNEAVKKRVLERPEPDIESFRPPFDSNRIPNPKRRYREGKKERERKEGMKKEREEGRKEGRKEGKKEGRKEGRKEIRTEDEKEDRASYGRELRCSRGKGVSLFKERSRLNPLGVSCGMRDE
uniref:Uncharacterized protein n=1 Tax=Vespula pensylvanica TaxID=30213 RepID=A0A834P2T4_VESPE|nr:hypothetical protein H0235_008243 [Vespula pensylvanica]